MINRQLNDLVLNNSEEDPQDQHNSQTEDGVNLNAEKTTSEVIAAMKAQKSTGKSRDGDNFHPKMLKNLIIDSCKFLSELFISCLQSGTWPWTDSYVTFVKKADKKTP